WSSHCNKEYKRKMKMENVTFSLLLNGVVIVTAKIAEYEPYHSKPDSTSLFTNHLQYFER
ncbi:MAG: hypothetical protein ACQEQI_08410, partial [Bacillota bacterium]